MVSSIGYDVQEVILGGRADVTVALSISVKVRDAVVVIGYGTASKRDLTGSIVKISGKEVADKPNINPVASPEQGCRFVYRQQRNARQGTGYPHPRNG